MYTFLPFYTFAPLHQFSFNMPPSGAEMNGLDRLLCAFTTCAMRKGVKCRLYMIIIPEGRIIKI